MNRDNTEDVILSLFDTIFDKESSFSQNTINGIVERLSSFKDTLNLSSPEDFNLFIVCKLERILSNLAKSYHKEPTSAISDTNKPNFIFKKYDFLKNNICGLCEKKTGLGCSVDKARYVINMYLEYSLTGVIPNDNPVEEHYWVPNFGSNSQWINFCDGLYHMYYGNPKYYLDSYKSLDESRIRLFKHVLHRWYVEFLNGDVINLTETWDDSKDNPLDKEFYNKDDYYLIRKSSFRKITKVNYECADDKDIVLRLFYKVPKSDIANIYKVSEEAMI